MGFKVQSILGGFHVGCGTAETSLEEQGYGSGVRATVNTPQASVQYYFTGKCRSSRFSVTQNPTDKSKEPEREQTQDKEMHFHAKRIKTHWFLSRVHFSRQKSWIHCIILDLKILPNMFSQERLLVSDSCKLGSANGYSYDGKNVGKYESPPLPLDAGRTLFLRDSV